MWWLSGGKYLPCKLDSLCSLQNPVWKKEPTPNDALWPTYMHQGMISWFGTHTIMINAIIIN